ncbi:hypothetical protein [Streptomyces caatingaensis]|uniref:Uncharacterized protein n=1 Tax=Streptomyces caatingaensis TaxID=1678637 RepID=A0A0K9XC66_9ACTN|nr:hypothetical protein [Streptomyces caatingaensis]KNB50242.1 hypothetical protein AC230_26610 [Streptomyces caatingaensis]
MSGIWPQERVLPTDRLQVKQQIQVLCALADLTGEEARPVRNADLARHMGRYADSVTGTLGYLVGTGLAEGGLGQYRATPAGREFATLWDTDSARARLVLNRLYQDHWAAREAVRILADGPLPQEEVARLLQQGLRGKKRRGIYLVEWLAIALVVHRDERLHVSLPPADDASAADSAQDASAPGGDARGGGRQEEAKGGGEALVMGLTMDQLRELPDEQFARLLNGLAQSIEALNTVPATPV